MRTYDRQLERIGNMPIWHFYDNLVCSSSNDTGDTAERYGYVNRALPDAELDGFVDLFARRIASFDRRPIAAAKNLINQVSLPYADRLLDAINNFQTALTWPETQQRIQALKARTPTGRRYRESMARAARHAPRDVVTMWRCPVVANSELIKFIG
jgi:hypothetical protein